MRIEIGKYVIVSDKLNWILQERRLTDPNHPLSKSEVAEERFVDLGYYGKLEHLCNSLLNRDLRQSEANTIQDLLKELNRIENNLKNAFKDIKREG